MTADDNNINEPEPFYDASPLKKKITFFNSFDEAEENALRKMASHSHEERLKNLEILRGRSFNRHRLSDGKSSTLKKIITIDFATYK